jgi:hypothetical protein
MTAEQKIYHRLISRSEKRTLFVAASIPFSMVAIAYIGQLLEYYFRFSKEYKWIYSNGSTVGFFLQILLLVGAFAFSIHLLLTVKTFRNKRVWLVSFLISISPLGYIILSFLS